MVRKKKPTITISELREYFKDVKSIKCLRRKIVIDVTGFDDFYYLKEHNSYTSPGAMVEFWKNGVFAEIVERIPEKDCGCNKRE